MFEIYYLPLHVEFGVEQPETPGMLTSLPPKRTQRSRSQDAVSLFLTITRGTPPPARIIDNMLEDAAAQYYKSSGSMTNGLKTAAEYLNALLIDYNSGIRESPSGEPVQAALNMAVLKGDLLSIMHAGSTSTLLLQPGQLQVFNNEDDHGRGLGLIPSIPVRFFQATVMPESLILFSANPPEKWNDQDLVHGARLSINLLRRRLLASDEEQFQAGIVQLKPSDQWAVHRLRLKSIQPGETTEGEAAPATAGSDAGKVPGRPEIRQIRRAATSTPETEPLLTRQTLITRENPPAAVTPAAIPKPELQESAERKPEILASEPEQVKTEDVLQPETVGVAETEAAEKSSIPARERISRSKAEPDPQKELERSARRQAFRKKLALNWQTAHQHEQKISSAASTFFERLLPARQEDERPKLSGGLMLAISIIVPLVVVFFAVSAYLEQGKGQQHQLYLDQAQVFAVDARQAEDNGSKRNSWQQVLYWLDLAEDYQKSDASRSLRSEAEAALDAMEGIQRLEFEDLFSFGFASSLNFTQIAANDTEVYLLDSNSGNVSRLFLTGQGYQLDEGFSCGPGVSGSQVIGEFVDIVSLPAGSPNKAAVLAVDASGNIAYCIPGEVAPLTAALAPPPKGWGSINAIALDQGTLYVLDSKAGAVYYYNGFTAGYGDVVGTFFDPERDETLPDMTDMIDLAASGEDLYLLHKNGTLAYCTSGVWEANQTRCQDPASFGDIRPIQSGDTLMFSETQFTQIQASSQPEPSLYLLDTGAPSVYRFSLQLNLDRLLRPSMNDVASLPDAAVTGFTISSTRDVFLAYGNRVFYSSLVK